MSWRFHIRYAATAFVAGLPMYGLMLVLPFTKDIFTPPGLLIPVRGALGPVLAFGCTSILVAYALRGLIVRGIPLLLVGAFGYSLGCAALVPVWTVSYDLRILLEGRVPPDFQEGLLTFVTGLLAGAFLGLSFGAAAAPAGWPIVCLMVWLLRKQAPTALPEAA